MGVPTLHTCGKSQVQGILLSSTMPGCLGPHVFRRAKIGKRCIYCTEFHPVPLFSGAVYLLTTFQGTTESCDFLRLESTALGQFPPLQTALLTLFALDIRP